MSTDQRATDYVAWARESGLDPDEVPTLRAYERRPGISRKHANELADLLYIGGGDADWRRA